MAFNNLRIVHDNIVNLSSTTLTASSSASINTLPVNLKLDAKSKIWRSSATSTSAVKVFLRVVFTASTVVNCVVLPFTNLTASATIRVYGYTGTIPVIGTGTVDNPTFTAGGTLVFDTGAGYLACPYQSFNVMNLGTIPIGSNMYAFGGGTYARAYVPTPTACTSMIIEISDINTNRYIEASRLIIGKYWSPRYNTSYGVTNSQNDTSSHTRTQSGDLVTTRGPRSGSISFDLKFMDKTDKSILYSLMRAGGISRPVFISLFPENSDDYDLEQMYQLYGKLTQLPGTQYINFLQYSSTIDMEEI